jgi:hypothetical protein
VERFDASVGGLVRCESSHFLSPGCAMSATNTSEMVTLDPEVVELSLLLPRNLANALEDVAEERGLTAGQMLRRIIISVVTQPKPAVSA